MKAEVLIVMVANIWPNHKIRVILAVPSAAAAVATTVAVFNECQETKLSRRKQPQKLTAKPQVTTDL